MTDNTGKAGPQGTTQRDLGAGVPRWCSVGDIQPCLDMLGCHTGVTVLPLASGGWGTKRLADVLRCTGRPPKKQSSRPKRHRSK